MSHGVPRSDEESPNRCGGSRTGLETDGAEAALSGLPHHGLGPSDPDAEEAGPDATVLGVAKHPGGEGGQRHGEPGRLLDGEIREGGSNAPVTDPQLCFASHRGSQLCDGRGPRVDGSTTNMCPSSSLRPIHDEETRPKLRTDVLAMSHGSRSAVPLLRMDTGAAQLEGTNGELGQFHRQPSDSNIAEVYGTEDTRTRTAGRVHPLSHDQSRDECLCLRVKCEICGKVLKNEARKESDTESARSNKSQASKEPKKKEQTKEPLKMTPEEIDEYEEFQRFRLWQQHRKDARSSGSSARNRKTSPEP